MTLDEYLNEQSYLDIEGILRQAFRGKKTSLGAEHLSNAVLDAIASHDSDLNITEVIRYEFIKGWLNDPIIVVSTKSDDQIATESIYLILSKSVYEYAKPIIYFKKYKNGKNAPHYMIPVLMRLVFSMHVKQIYKAVAQKCDIEFLLISDDD